MPITISFYGRPVSQAELGFICGVIHDFPASVYPSFLTPYHYLGYKVPCGAQLRAASSASRLLSNQIAACLLFTSAALKIAPGHEDGTVASWKIDR